MVQSCLSPLKTNSYAYLSDTDTLVQPNDHVKLYFDNHRKVTYFPHPSELNGQAQILHGTYFVKDDHLFLNFKKGEQPLPGWSARSLRKIKLDKEVTMSYSGPHWISSGLDSIRMDSTNRLFLLDK